MSDVYPSCTICYKDLSEEDKKMNADNNNVNFPLCRECLNEGSNAIKEALKE